MKLIHRIPKCLAAALSAFALASCTLVGSYDPIVDRNINDVSVKTETILVEADRGELTNAEQQTYFSESIGMVRATRARSGLQNANEEETLALKELEDRLQALADRGRPLRSSVATGLKLSLLDLQQIEIAKKRSTTFSRKLDQSE
ncbi:MAG: hypothetical protein V4689_18600 [Verrucomicrobiota bacterium]